jgi:hypothetical protein
MAEKQEQPRYVVTHSAYVFNTKKLSKHTEGEEIDLSHLSQRDIDRLITQKAVALVDSDAGKKAIENRRKTLEG